MAAESSHDDPILDVSGFTGLVVRNRPGAPPRPR